MVFFYHFRDLIEWKRNWADIVLKVYKLKWIIMWNLTWYVVLHASGYLTFDKFNMWAFTFVTNNYICIYELYMYS